MSKEFTEADRQSMDTAAASAEADLENIPEEALQVVAGWWGKWYPDAGHKRLARVLLQYASKEKEE
jgi:hypothetical protein